MRRWQECGLRSAQRLSPNERNCRRISARVYWIYVLFFIIILVDCNIQCDCRAKQTAAFYIWCTTEEKNITNAKYTNQKAIVYSERGALANGWTFIVEFWVSVRLIKIYWRDMLCRLCARLWHLETGCSNRFSRDFSIRICIWCAATFADIDGHSARIFAPPLLCQTDSHWYFVRLANCNDVYVSTMFVLHFDNFMHSI